VDCDFGIQLDKIIDLSPNQELKVVVSIRNPNAKVCYSLT